MSMESVIINKNNKLRSGFKVLLVAAASLVSILVLSLIQYGIVKLIYSGNHQLIKSSLAGKGLEFLGQCMPEIIFILVPILAWKFIEKKPLKDMGFVCNRKGARDFIIGLIFGAATISAVSLALIFTGNISLTGSLLNPKFTAAILIDIVLYTLVGFGEETLFRGYCMGTINQYNKKWVGIVVSSVLFSLAHAANPNVKPLFFINVVLVGLLFAYMYFKSSSLWLPIGFHIMWDYFEGDIWGLPDSGNVVQGIYQTKIVHENIINGGLVGPEGGLAVTLIILLSFLIVKLCYSRHSDCSKID